ncbi:EF-hand calcium-binding domain-containing protein 4B isoform X3 [Dama dama]|uniref:EF-hand calcium-binding domain-containing protein 4B isoform X3 n=1 Tax=Dama dama TaxID=30532 RepID=UPI002A36EADF|nr:EF-hand calcium-binding domain-containing protein 4B isoform X3 [Dama dama]
MATIDGRMVSRRRGSGWGRQGSGACLGSLDDPPCEGTQLAMLRRAQEFFQTCDTEGKGFIARADMQRLHKELPLSLEDLEDVFDALDADGNGFLTPEEFTTGFSHFFFSQNNPSQEDGGEQPAQLQEEKVYQSRGDEDLGYMDEDEEAQFQNLMDRLGAQKVLEDEADVKQLWLRLKKDEPHLLSNFEDFLTRIFSQLLEAHEEKNELECALKKKIAAYDEEIQHLYEEMEQQIKTEKEQFLLKDTERFRARSQELERKLLSKEQELEQLVQKQKRLEGQCTALHNDKHETKAENTKLRLTNQELARELERTSRELQDAQQQLESLRQEAHKLHQEKEMEVYRVTESLQREKSGLLKQLDFLRERNKHLRDEQDIRFQKEGSPSTPDRLFKIVFVGNSSVGKTSFLGRFCDGRFSPGSAATVGIDYRVKTVCVDGSRVAVQLWDTAGQERYRCITQQFFRKADGVVVMYDLTARQSFLDVRQWLSSVEEAVGDRIPVLLLGNKIDNETEREVPRGLGEQLAKEHNLIFYECSAYSGHNAEESVLHLARILKEQEDTVQEDTIQVDRPAKKKACCG